MSNDTIYEASLVDLVYLVSLIIGLIIHSKDAPTGILGWLISKRQQSRRQTEALVSLSTLHRGRFTRIVPAGAREDVSDESRACFHFMEMNHGTLRSHIHQYL